MYKNKRKRSRNELDKEAEFIHQYVASAPVKGRRYADMVRKVYQYQNHTMEGFDTFEHRSLLIPIMSRLWVKGLAKDISSGRYFILPEFTKSLVIY